MSNSELSHGAEDSERESLLAPAPAASTSESAAAASVAEETVPPSVPASAVAQSKSDVFSESERSAINSLRDRLRKEIPNIEDADCRELASSYLDDGTMWRYALSTGYDEKASADVFISSMKWRQEWQGGVNKLTQQWTDNDTSPEVLLGRMCCYAGMCGRHKGGGPMIYERLGKCDLGGLSLDPEAREATLKAYICYMENIFQELHRLGGKAQTNVVLDMAGFGLTTFLRHLGQLRAITNLVMPNYPETGAKIYIVRAPWGVQTVWKLFSPILAKRTRDKIHFIGSDFLEFLANDVVEGGLAAIPDFLGGQKKVNCHWRNGVCEAMPIAEAKAKLKAKHTP